MKYTLLNKLTHQINRFQKSSNDHINTAAENFYKNLYLKHIIEQIEVEFEKGKALSILDGGCGPGRFSIEMAKHGHNVTGIDNHASSIEQARRNSEREGVSIELIQNDLLKALEQLKGNSFDIGLCIEVLLVCVEYRGIIREFARIIKPDGLFIASFRSSFYLVTTLLLKRQYEQALRVLEENEGILRIASIPAYYNWQSLDEISSLYMENNLHPTKMVPIGIFTGAGYDGMAAVSDLNTVAPDILDNLVLKIESAEQDEFKGIGRYTLAIGKKYKN